jgi:multiple sugar transport system permease protein
MFPLLWMTSLAFKSPDTFRSGDQGFWPQDWTWDNFQTVFDDELFTSALRNSFGIAIIATVLSVIVAMFAAYAIARLDFRGKKLLLSMALAIAMFPQAALVGPLFNMWRGLGIYDTWLGLIIPYLTFALPLSIWTMSAFFRQIPWEMEQAAQVDGATAWQAFRKVIVPLAAPGVFTTAILTFFFCWNEFLFAISLTSTDAARIGGRDHPHHHHRPDLPAPDRRRADQRRRQGLNRGSTTHGLHHHQEPRQALRRRFPRRQRREPGHRRRRVHDPRRTVGLREVDPAADDRRPRGHHRG